MAQTIDISNIVPNAVVQVDMDESNTMEYIVVGWVCNGENIIVVPTNWKRLGPSYDGQYDIVSASDITRIISTPAQ